MSRADGRRPGGNGATESVGKFRTATDTRHPATTQQAPDAAIADAFEQELAEAIMELITQSCRVKDTDSLILRVSESVSALVTVLAATLALSPTVVRSPTSTRRTVDRLAKLLRRRVAAALASQNLGGSA